MEPFATVADLEARWRALGVDEAARAKTLLDDATSILRAKLGRAGVVVDADNDVLLRNLKVVCCSMVQRVMTASVNTTAYKQASETVGPFSQSWTLANPSGDMYLTRDEKQRLSLSTQKIGVVRPEIGVADHDW